MKELTLPESDFIGGWYINPEVCDGLISFFNDSPNQRPGEIGRGVDEEFKISTDVNVCPRNPDQRIQDYLDVLTNVCDLYCKKFEYATKMHSLWGLNTNFNVQKYNPGEGFYGWHSERTSIRDTVPYRHLVFMTYLNTVTDAGETEWYHQKLKMQPEKGLTVIWPCDWTHTHRGVTSPTQTKYITTGWYTYHIPDFDYDALNYLGELRTTE
tara:strand:+ start:649 stop:1281 length:633 start_codon:yes stop_codon:yes gene_type:complete